MSLAMTSALPCAHAKAGCNTKAFRPQARSAPRAARSAHVVKASVADMELVPDSNRRTIMNLLLVGAIGLPVASLAGYAHKQLACLYLLSMLTLCLNAAVLLQAVHLFLCTKRVGSQYTCLVCSLCCNRCADKGCDSSTVLTILAVACRAGGGSAGITAKDALGNDVKASQWLKSHPAGDRNLVQGLKVPYTL